MLVKAKDFQFSWKSGGAHFDGKMRDFLRAAQIRNPAQAVPPPPRFLSPSRGWMKVQDDRPRGQRRPMKVAMFLKSLPWYVAHDWCGWRVNPDSALPCPALPCPDRKWHILGAVRMLARCLAARCSLRSIIREGIAEAQLSLTESVAFLPRAPTAAATRQARTWRWRCGVGRWWSRWCSRTARGSYHAARLARGSGGWASSTC